MECNPFAHIFKIYLKIVKLFAPLLTGYMGTNFFLKDLDVVDINYYKYKKQVSDIYKLKYKCL